MENKTNTKTQNGVYRKILELQRAVRALLPNAAGGGDKNSYRYVSGSKLLGYLRPKMDNLGIILKQEIVEESHERIDYATAYGHKSEMFTALKMRFTWIDVDTGERDENEFIAFGQNGWDKGLGSALTYGERYFLLKFFHIATDEDDVDALPINEAMPANVQMPPTPGPAPRPQPAPAIPQAQAPAPVPAPSRGKQQPIQVKVVQAGDDTYMKLIARINKGQLDTIDKALKSDMVFSGEALAMLEQAQRDFKPNSK